MILNLRITCTRTTKSRISPSLLNGKMTYYQFHQTQVYKKCKFRVKMKFHLKMPILHFYQLDTYFVLSRAFDYDGKYRPILIWIWILGCGQMFPQAFWSSNAQIIVFRQYIQNVPTFIRTKWTL